MSGEVWRVIPSLPEYLASTEGRVMRVPFLGTMPYGGPKHYGGQPQFGVWNKESGRFVLPYHGKNHKVHRLICEAFNGPAPDDKPVCMHLDENAANNRPTNLAWGTQKENLNAPAVKEYHRARTGENNPLIKGIKAREGCI
jgi:hypothetical protein